MRRRPRHTHPSVRTAALHAPDTQAQFQPSKCIRICRKHWLAMASTSVPSTYLASQPKLCQPELGRSRMTWGAAQYLGQH